MDFVAELTLGKTYDLSKHSVPNGTWIVEGYASTSDLDAQNHIVSPEAIKMGAESLQKYDTVLFNHDPDRPIGKVQSAEAIDGKLLIKVAISKTEPKIWEQIKDGTLSKFSIRGTISDSEYYTDERTLKDILIIKGMELHEVSLVSVPANPHARSLSWYIEKAMQEAKGKSDKEPVESTVVVKLDATDLERVLEKAKDKNVFELAIANLQAGLDSLQGEDKDQVQSIIRSLNALIGRVYRKSIDDVKGGQTVEEVKKDDTEVKKEDKKAEEVKKSEKTEIDLEAVKSVITQLQSMVKDASASVEQVNKSVADIAKAKDEISKEKEDIAKSKEDLSKMMKDLSDAMKEIPIRKGAAPEKEEDRTKETVVTKSITETEAFQKLRPDQQLHALVSAHINAD